MGGPIYVLLPPTATHLVPVVLGAGGIPVVDATGPHPPHVPDGAWVRTRPGRPAPGTGPVLLAELGAPVTDRPTWLETIEPRDIPSGFAGLVLKGREAGGAAGDADGLRMLAQCPDRSRVILDAGVGPASAAAAAALGAAGVLVAEQHLACPELALPPGLARRLDVPDDEITRVVAGLRVANAATAPVLRKLAEGQDPWRLADGLWERGDARESLWLAGQGLALARGLAERHGTLAALVRAYADAWARWPSRVRQAVAVEGMRAVGTAAALSSPGTAAASGGIVGSAVLWEEAAWLGRPVAGAPLEGAVATGLPVAAPAADVDRVARELLSRAPAEPEPVAAPPAPEPPPSAPVAHATTPVQPVAECAPDEAHATSSRPGGAIAIVGMGCRFPGSDGLADYWRSVVEGRSAIGEVPKDRWDPALYFDRDPNAPDKSYTAIGGFVRDFKFEPKKFRIPPKVAKQIDPVQQITLTCVAEALEDAGLQVDAKSAGKPFDRERCAVILGNSLGGEVKDEYAKRIAWPEMANKLRAELGDLPKDRLDDFLARMEKRWKEGMPEVDEDSMPGELSNVIAGRIANAFDLAGANFTVDAACASSMAAIQAAVKGLQDGDFDLAVTGGADRSMNIATYVKFCKIGALSPDHSSPFDESANGFVMGEGCGILLLKRYEDAVRDGDRVYAVIRGVGASSDGKGKGITAPNPAGQLRALERAYTSAGVDPATVDLVECHGTSTVVGDKIEVEALSDFIGPGRRGERGPVRIGSVKSQIGHLKSAAGAASVIKAALALYHGVLPPSIGYRKGRSDVPFDKVPLQVQTSAEPWPATPEGVRRAGVSAFGFGGTNFHVVLESFAGQALAASDQPRPTSVPAPAFAPAPAALSVPPVPVPVPAVEAPRPVEAPLARPAAVEVVERTWPEGVWCASARDSATLAKRLQALKEGRLVPWNPSEPLRIASAADSVEEFQGQLDRAIKVIEKGSNPDMLRARSIYFEDAPFDGKLAMLFTGQGSQYLEMGLDLAKDFPVVRETFEQADRILTPELGRPITSFIHLSAGESEAEKEDLLRQTEYSQPATLTIDIAILRLLAAYGIVPDLVAGHSLGEYAACVAAGIMTFEDALYAVTARGREMASIRIDDPGKMAGIAASTETVEEVLAEVQGYVIAANKNCPSQTVIAGASDAVDEACERFKARGITVYPLPVSHAFHSRIVAPASEPLRKVLEGLNLREPVRPITTNVTAEYYPTGPGAQAKIVDLLARQIGAPVEWTAQIERMYEDGARTFVEVGPKRALTGFVVSILKRRPHRALYTNHPKRGGTWSFRDALAGLLVVGAPVRATPTEGIPDLFPAPEPKRSTTEAVTAHLALHPEQPEQTEAIPDIREGILRIVARQTGYDVKELDPNFELEADLGIDTVKQAEVFSVVRSTYGIPADPSFSFADHKTLQSVIDWAATKIGATRPQIAESAPAATSAPAPSAPPAPSTSAPLFGDDVVATFLESAAKAGIDSSLDGSAFARALLPAVQGLLAAAFEAAKAATPVKVVEKVVEKPVVVVEKVPVAAPSVPAAAPARPQGQVTPKTSSVVCSGASIGLPGGDEVFAPGNFAAMLSGENRISHIGDRAKEFLGIGLVRLVKDAQSGEGSFLPVEDESQVIRLGGTKAFFDPSAYGLPESLVRALDVTSELAIAAGLEALRDAGIPLVRAYKPTANGKRVPVGWMLPEALRDETGVIFASAFPGYDQLVQKLRNNGDDGEGHFDRRFLFQILSMGHSQFAQLIGARGPNTQVNAACASTTQAIVMASDWIRLGRCKRVLVLGADDVTNDNLFKWIGGGFQAAGAATTKDVVEEAALPFDRRRHGMIIGMGAVGFVLESDDACQERGVTPIARLLGGTIANSAFHGTRLDPPHIASVFKRLVDGVCADEGLTPSQIASSAVFMSHETYTPARGGSAAAEIEALRAAFGPTASQISIANTKGLTGHPMGAGIEDAIAVKVLQYGIVPPVANFREPDEELGDLRISRGERRDVRYAVRLSAGFGSQLALTVWERVARGDERVPSTEARAAWLKRVTGYAHVAEEIEQRTLRVVEAKADALLPLVPEVSPAVAVRLPGEAGIGETATAPSAVRRPPSAPAAAPPAPVAASVPLAAPPDAGRREGAVSGEGMLTELMALVAHKTGYDTSELEPDFELEADLGIDTVKQAEIFSEIRERHGLARDDGFKLADYPTIAKLAGYLAERTGTGAASETPAAMSTPPVAGAASETLAATKTAPVAAVPVAAPAAVSSDAMLGELLALVADKTGYEPSELEPDFELEADLGVDTVKQAEIFSEIRERHGLARDDSFKLADYPTIAKLAGYLAERTAEPSAPSAVRPPPSAEHAPAPVTATPTPVVDDESPTEKLPPLKPAPEAPAAPPVSAGPEADGGRRKADGRDDGGATAPAVSREAMLGELLALVADKTGYDPGELEPDFELEADLGIDTVKQAEIFSEIRERHGLARDDSFKLADYPTIAKLAGYLAERTAVPSSEPSAVRHPPSAEQPADALEAPATTPVTEGPDADGGPAPRRGSTAEGSEASAPKALDDSLSHEEFDLGAVWSSASPDQEWSSPPLPPSFRIRRPVLVERPVTAGGTLRGRRVLVLGDDRRAEAVRKEVVARGGSLEAPHDAVIDVADDVMTSFRKAKELATPPRAWLTLTRLADLDQIVPLERAFVDGARAGFTKALGREWAQTKVRVLGLPPGTAEEDVARAACDELAAGAGPTEVFRRGNDRRIVAYQSEAAPRPGMLVDAPVVLVTGGGRGISARIALELARRGPVRLALVGRGPMAEAETDLQAEKERIKAALKATTARVTPVEIEKRLDPLRRAEEIRRNVAQMEALGAEVKYFRADLADAASVAALLEDVENVLGPVDVVIHGAGVEESRPLADKDEGAFHRVFDGKAKGGLALVQALGPEVYFISMGSVAGRFGNAGQVDYSAANDAMARLCLTRPRSLHVDWTAWDDVGMAVRGGMRTLLTDRGIDLLPADAGAALLVDLVAGGVTGEIVVAGKLGDMLAAPDHPLLDKVEIDGDKVKAWKTLSVDTDGWIRDHSIDATPVLPGVIGLELMAAAAQVARPGLPYVGARNVKFEQPVKLHREGDALLLVIEAEPSGETEVRCKLVSERTLRTGRLQRTEHFSAIVQLGEAKEPEPLPSAFFPDEEIPADEIYRRFFHGPAFQVLKAVQGVSADGLLAEAACEPASIAEHLVTEPLALEAAFQASGLHRMLVAAEMALPMGVEQVRVLRACPAGEKITLMVHLDDDRYHVDVDGTDGPILRLRGFAMVDRGPLSPDRKFPEPPEGRPHALLPSKPKASARSGATVARASWEDEPERWLSPDEQAELRARGTDRRVRDRLAGRIAAKRALSQLTGVDPTAIRIETAPSGEPLARVLGHPTARVSISHRDGKAVAVAVSGGRVGIDLERVEPRPAGFEDDWFADDERDLVGRDARKLTIAWAVKEAVQKALGLGMALDPREIRVERLTAEADGDAGGTASVRLVGEAAAELASAGGPLVVTWAMESADEVLVQARIAA